VWKIDISSFFPFLELHNDQLCAAISVFWCLGGGAEAGECRKQEIDRNADGDV